MNDNSPLYNAIINTPLGMLIRARDEKELQAVEDLAWRASESNFISDEDYMIIEDLCTERSGNLTRIV